ncbi:MAG: hypothetical protein WCH31_07940 [Actinomycetes bacterium]
MIVGMAALTWVIAGAMFGAWPIVGVLAFYVRRSWRRHDAEHGKSH